MAGVFDTRIFGRAINYRGRDAALTTDQRHQRADRSAPSRHGARTCSPATNCCVAAARSEIVGSCAEVRLSAGARALVQASGIDCTRALHAVLRAVHPDDRARVFLQWRRAKPGKPFEFRHRLLRADGTVLRVLHRGLMEIVESEAHPRPVAILQDITEQSAAQDQIERLVNYHPVTGLATRTLLLKRAAVAIELSQRENRPVAMLFLRVSEVDRVHDALGLRAGDALATTPHRALAERLPQPRTPPRIWATAISSSCWTRPPARTSRRH